jgi:ribosome-associated toxin RatA of RatAB toxin-antitoxin module
MASSRIASVTGGGRTGARCLLACTAVAILYGGFGAVAAAVAQPRSEVTVQENGGSYRVAATFSVSQPAAVVMEVLADYDAIPRFMPDVRTSTVLERDDDYAVVEQEAVAKFLMFSKRIHLVLEVHQAAGSLRFRDRCGNSFSSYEGRWTVTQAGDHTHIAYELTARPAFEVPEFLLRRLLKRDSTRMIQLLTAEIAARHRTDPPAAALPQSPPGARSTGGAHHGGGSGSGAWYSSVLLSCTR